MGLQPNYNWGAPPCRYLKVAGEWMVISPNNLVDFHSSTLKLTYVLVEIIILKPLSARVYVNLLDSNNQMKLMGVVIDQSLLYYPLKEMGLYTTLELTPVKLMLIYIYIQTIPSGNGTLRRMTASQDHA